VKLSIRSCDAEEATYHVDLVLGDDADRRGASGHLFFVLGVWMQNESAIRVSSAGLQAQHTTQYRAVRRQKAVLERLL
jgi:hypothetical protein